MTQNTVIIGVAIVAGIISPETEAQPKGRGDAPREDALKEPFKGVYYLDVPPANLFPIRKTGVSTEPVRQAAKAFLVSLTPADRKKTLFGVDDLEWRKWDNRHRYV